MDTPRFLQCNPMVQILVVQRKALRRVLICLVETLRLLWKVCLVGLCFPMLNQSVKGRRLKRRQAVGCERCEGWRRRWRLCGMGNRCLVVKMRSWMGRLGGGQVREGTNCDEGMKRGLSSQLWLLMVAS